MTTYPQKITFGELRARRAHRRIEGKRVEAIIDHSMIGSAS
jgi:hypothetical protein